MRKFVVLAILIGVLGTAGLAIADPNLVFTGQAHRHYIQKGGKLVEVGPNYCDNPNLLSAFTQFHANTHTHNGVTGEIGPVAPGLHNSLGADLTFGPC